MVYTFFSLLVVDLRLVENVGMVGQLVETSKMRDYYLSRLLRKAAFTVNGSVQMLFSR